MYLLYMCTVPKLIIYKQKKYQFMLSRSFNFSRLGVIERRTLIYRRYISCSLRIVGLILYFQFPEGLD